MTIWTKTGNQFWATVVGNLDYNKLGKSVSNIEIEVNGEKRQIGVGVTVLQYLESLEITTDRVAVELNRAIVKKAEWPQRVIEAGARLEIVQFVGGG